MANLSPGVLEQAVHYGLFSQRVADKLREKIPLTQEELAELASDLATAYQELAKLFEVATSHLKPPTGYRRDKGVRIIHPWDLIARFMNRKRVLLLLDHAQLSYILFKARVVASSNPEKTVAKKEEKARTLAKVFPHFTEGTRQYYVWEYRQPEQKLRDAERYYNRLLDLLKRRWIYPAVDLLGYSVKPEGCANFAIARGTAKAENILSAIAHRDEVIRKGLTTQQAEVLRQLSTQLPGLAADLEGPQAAPGYSQARDLLNRVVAWRQTMDPTFFTKLSDPMLDSSETVIASAQPLIEQIIAHLRQEQSAGHWPKEAEELDLFLKGIAETLPNAGLEEREVAVARDLAVAAWGGVFLPAASVESQVLIFSDPKTFDLVPLAVRWGRTVGVNYDGSEADAIRELLNKLPFDKGAYAIGKQATRMLLMESGNPIWIANRADALRRLGLNPDELPPVVQEAIDVTQDYLGLFV